jgi:hypothetical protein
MPSRKQGHRTTRHFDGLEALGPVSKLLRAAMPALRAHVRTSTLRAVLGFALASRRSRHWEDSA